MPFDETQREQAVQFARQRLTGRLCPVCSNAAWEVQGEFAGMLAMPRQYISFLQDRGPQVFVTLVITCSVCGHMLLFRADKTGVNPPPVT